MNGMRQEGPLQLSANRYYQGKGAISALPTAVFCTGTNWSLFFRKLAIYAREMYEMPIPMIVILSQQSANCDKLCMAGAVSRKIRFIVKVDDFDWNKGRIPLFGDVAIHLATLEVGDFSLIMLKHGFEPIVIDCNEVDGLLS